MSSASSKPFSSVRHAFPHPKSDTVTMLASAGTAYNEQQQQQQQQVEPVRLSPSWLRSRFLAFFSLLGEEMIGELATPKRAAREAAALLEVAAELARTFRWRRQVQQEQDEQEHEYQTMMATIQQQRRSGFQQHQQQAPPQRDFKRKTKDQISTMKAPPLNSTADPSALFPNHLAMFDSDNDFSTAWQHCLRKVFYCSILSEADRAAQRQMSDDEFARLPLPPREALPNEDQLEAVARRIFWVERIGAYYVAANVSVPRDADSIDSAVGQLLLEGHSYEEIWERVQSKYGVYVVVAHNRDAPQHSKMATLGGGGGVDNDALSKMSPLERAEVLMQQTELQKGQAMAARAQQRAAAATAATAKSRTAVVAQPQQQHDAATQTMTPAVLLQQPFVPSSTSTTTTKGGGEPRSDNFVSVVEEDEDLKEVERIAHRLFKEMQEKEEKAAAATVANNNNGDTGGQQQQQQEGDKEGAKKKDTDDDDIVAPPPPGDDDDSEGDDVEDGLDFSGAAATATKLKGEQQQQQQQQQKQDSLSSDDELKLAAMLLQSMPASDTTEAFDASKMLVLHAKDNNNGNGRGLSADLKRHLSRVTSSAIAKIPLEGRGGGGIDAMRRSTVQEEQRRRAARLRLVDESTEGSGDNNNNEQQQQLQQPPQKSASSTSLKATSSYSRFNYDDHMDPVTGIIPSSVIRALSSATSKGEFERMKELSDAAAASSAFGNVSDIVEMQHQDAASGQQEEQAAPPEQQQPSSMLTSNSSLMHQQSLRSSSSSQQQPQPETPAPVPQQQQQRRPPPAEDPSSAAGVFRCAFHVTGVVRSQLVSHMNMPTSSLLSLIGDFEEAVSKAFDRLPGAVPRKRFDLGVPLRALALRVAECNQREGGDCTEVIVALTGRNRPQPYSMLRGAAMQTLSVMAGEQRGEGEGEEVLPLRLRAALGFPASSGIVSFVVHDMKAATDEATLQAKSSSSSSAASSAPPPQKQQQQPPKALAENPPNNATTSTTTSSSSPAAAANSDSFRARIVRFYERYDKSKLPNVDKLVLQYGGKGKGTEDELFAKLTAIPHYGPEPPAPPQQGGTTTTTTTTALRLKEKQWSAAAIAEELANSSGEHQQQHHQQQQNSALWTGPAFPPNKFMSTNPGL